MLSKMSITKSSALAGIHTSGDPEEGGAATAEGLLAVPTDPEGLEESAASLTGREASVAVAMMLEVAVEFPEGLAAAKASSACLSNARSRSLFDDASASEAKVPAAAIAPRRASAVSLASSTHSCENPAAAGSLSPEWV